MDSVLDGHDGKIPDFSKKKKRKKGKTCHLLFCGEMLHILALMEEDGGGDLVPPLEHLLPTPSGEQLVNQQAIPEDSLLDLEVRHRRRQSRS